MCTTSRPEIGARRSASRPAPLLHRCLWSAASSFPDVVTDIFTTVDSCYSRWISSCLFFCCISRTIDSLEHRRLRIARRNRPARPPATAN